MIILKKHNGRYILFNTDSTDMINQLQSISNDEYIELSKSKEAYKYHDKEFLDKYFNKNHIIFDNFGESYFFILKNDNISNSLNHNFATLNSSINYVDNFIKGLRIYGYYSHRPDKTTNEADDSFQFDSITSLRNIKEYIAIIEKDSSKERQLLLSKKNYDNRK